MTNGDESCRFFFRFVVFLSPKSGSIECAGLSLQHFILHLRPLWQNIWCEPVQLFLDTCPSPHSFRYNFSRNVTNHLLMCFCFSVVFTVDGCEKHAPIVESEGLCHTCFFVGAMGKRCRCYKQFVKFCNFFLRWLWQYCCEMQMCVG